MNRSSGYRRCDIRSPSIADSGWSAPGKMASQACSSGSVSSQAYSSTSPLKASTVALTEFLM